MNWDRIEGNWKQLTGKAKEQWGKMTDDDINVIAGKREQLSGKLQDGATWDLNTTANFSGSNTFYNLDRSL